MINVFDELFVLEISTNHWGSVERGLEIIDQHAKVVNRNGVRAAIKLQVRDVQNFIHPDHWSTGNDASDISMLPKRERYIEKTKRTQLDHAGYQVLVDSIKRNGIEPIATAFDEQSVDTCLSLGITIIKVASADFHDFNLLEKIAETRLPVIASTGGCTESQIDDGVDFFTAKNIPLALNHCVSLYPTEDSDLQLNQIDYLKKRYPDLTIGFSSHEYHDWQSSMYISFAKGARLWERHIDIPYSNGFEQKAVTPYCSLPYQIDTWFKAYHHAKLMCGSDRNRRRVISPEESQYLKSLHRGIYFSRDIGAGELLNTGDFFVAIPCQYELGQIPSGGLDDRKYRAAMKLSKGQPVTKDCLTHVL